MKYRVKIWDHTFWDAILPLCGFNILNGTNINYYVQIYKGIWPFGKWETLLENHCKEDAYVFLMKEKYKLEIPTKFEWNWNSKYEWFSKNSKLRLKENLGNFYVGYFDEDNSKYKLLYISKISYEDGLIGLMNILPKITYKHKFDYDKIKY